MYDEVRQYVAALLTPMPRFGTTIWCVDGNTQNAVTCLNEAFPEGYFICGDSYYLKKNDMHPTVCHASNNRHTIYSAIVNAGIWTNKEALVAVPRDWLESKYLAPAEDWQNKIEYRWVSAREWETLMYDTELMDYPWQRNKYGNYSVVGFHYLNYSFYPSHTNYLMAMVDNKPIGCICITEYRNYGYYAVQYIDVCVPYKNNGVAKGMIHALTQHIPADMPLLVSMESEEGKKCHITECFKREKWPHSAVTQEEFDAICKNKRSFDSTQ